MVLESACFEHLFLNRWNYLGKATEALGHKVYLKGIGSQGWGLYLFLIYSLCLSHLPLDPIHSLTLCIHPLPLQATSPPDKV